MTDWYKIEWDVTYSGSYTRERIEDIAAMDPDSGIAGPNLRSKIFACREWVRNNPAGLTRAEFEALPNGSIVQRHSDGRRFVVHNKLMHPVDEIYTPRRADILLDLTVIHRAGGDQ